MLIFNGKKEAERILSELGRKIKKLRVKPGLAVISVDSDPASKLFIRRKKEAAQRIGLIISHFKFKSKVKEKVILEKIDRLNDDKSVNGIIVQLPLVKGLDTKKIINRISLRKDVDGFRKNSYFSSPLLSAVLIALRSSNKSFKGKKVLALVNSDIFGRALKLFLGQKGIKVNYCKGRKSSKLKSADVLITVLGVPKFIKGEMVKEGAILIDGGITVIAGRKVRGDVDKKSLGQKASFLTPVPGGIGPLNIALLLKNVYLAKNYGTGGR